MGYNYHDHNEYQHPNGFQYNSGYQNSSDVYQYANNGHYLIDGLQNLYDVQQSNNGFVYPNDSQQSNNGLQQSNNSLIYPNDSQQLNNGLLYSIDSLNGVVYSNDSLQYTNNTLQYTTHDLQYSNETYLNKNYGDDVQFPNDSSGYVAPFNIFNTWDVQTNPPVLMPNLDLIPDMRNENLEDVGYLEPGKPHQLSRDLIPTAQSVLDGSYSAALRDIRIKDIVKYVPRIPAYRGQPSLPSIVFSSGGKPGPYLENLISGDVVLDMPFDEVFKDTLWNRTSITVDWPGVTTSHEYYPCHSKSDFHTRTQVARLVAMQVSEIIASGSYGKSLKWGPQVLNADTREWNLKKIDYRFVRLIAINYYRKTWVPVLAI